MNDNDDYDYVDERTTQNIKRAFKSYHVVAIFCVKKDKIVATGILGST